MDSNNTNNKTYNQYPDTNYKQLWINENIKEIHKIFPTLEKYAEKIYLSKPKDLEWNDIAVIDVIDSYEEMIKKI